MTDELQLILRAFKIFNGFEGCSCDNLWWRTDGEYAPVTLLVNCNDLFFWACADAEPLTLDNIAELEKAAEDMKAASPNGDYSLAHLLFCCRMNGMRPQTPYYKYIPEHFKPLFDACGEVRIDA